MLETIVLIVLGLVIGAVTVWLILQSKIATAETQARSESQTDIARLNERLVASQHDISRLTVKCR
jgi:hypothetical protein